MHPTVHQLKTWPELYPEVAEGRMNFQIRRDDREFKIGDHLDLREYDPAAQQFTGRYCERRVTSIFESRRLLAGENKPVIAQGFVVLGVERVPYGQSLLEDQRPAHVVAP